MKTKNSKNWWQRLTSKLSPNKNEDARFTYFTVKDRNYEETFDRIGKWQIKDKNIHDKQALINQLTKDAAEFREIGETDGWRGLTPESVAKITTNIARLWKSFIQSSFQQRRTVALGRQGDIAVKYDHILGRINSLQEHKKAIDTHYKYHSKHYSLLFGLIYIIAAAFLIIADFPLAKKIVQEGFDLMKETHASMLAIGIVFLSAFIKIIYDEYLGNSIQKTLLNQRSDKLLGEGFEASSEELEKAKRIRLWQLISKLGILSLVITTILALGFFRFDLSIIPKDSEAGNIYKSLLSSQNGKWSFILLSIALPIVGGVCASVGFRNIRNVLDQKLINRRIRKTSKEKQGILEKKLIVDGLIKECDENLEWVKEEGEKGFVQECADYFFSCYMHGYNRGINLSTPEDYYDVASYARNRSLIQRSSNYLSHHSTDEHGNLILRNFFSKA